jgi:hypothetical protein
MLKQIGIVAGFLAVAGVAGGLFVAKAAPERELTMASSRTVPAGGKPFAPVCKSGELLDSRPDPAWVGASFEKDGCKAPGMPKWIDGATATREQVTASMEELKRYTAASDSFEMCIQDFVEARKAGARAGGQALSTPLVIIENHRIAVSQRNRKLAADRVKATITSFNEYGSDCG